MWPKSLVEGDTLKAGSRLPQLMQMFILPQPYARPQEKIFGGIAAFVGVFGLVAGSYYFAPDVKVIVVASMGASAVLFFAAPHSPLAQPWPFVGGHLLSAMIGVSCYKIIPDPFTAAAAAVSLAIVLMHFLHCLHPPGGATALMAVIGGDTVHDLGFDYMLWPVGINVVLFLVLALLINNLLVPGRRYPLPVTEPALKKTVLREPFGKLGVERADLEDALKEIGAYIDVGDSDLEEIYSLATLHARQRALTKLKVLDIMQREVPTCEYDDKLPVVWEQMRIDHNMGLPVIDCTRRVTGIVTVVDFLKHVDGHLPGAPGDPLVRLIHRTPGLTTDKPDKPEVAGQIMTAPAITVRDDASVTSLIAVFAEDKIHHLPVVNGEQRLVGMVTQAELLTTLHSLRLPSASSRE